MKGISKWSGDHRSEIHDLERIKDGRRIFAVTLDPIGGDHKQPALEHDQTIDSGTLRTLDA